MSTFAKGSVVSHTGGLWFANSDTSGEPGYDSAWQLMVQGVATDGGAFNLSQAWKGVYQGPTPAHDALFAPSATIDFELPGSLPPYMSTTGAVLNSGYRSSNYGPGSVGVYSALVDAQGQRASSSLSFEVVSTGDAVVTVLASWHLASDADGYIRLQGAEVLHQTGAGPNDQYGTTTFAVPAGTWTIEFDVDAGMSGTESWVAIDQITVSGTTPDGYYAGYNSQADSTQGTAYNQGDLVSYKGDLYLALYGSQGTSPSSLYPYWAQLSTHAASTALPSGATSGQVLTWDGTAWTAATPAAGGSGSSGEVHTFASAGQWTVNHAIGRIPSVTVYDAGGKLLLAEAAATSTQVVITFANPTAGTAVLT